jgi:hypothetical protein
LGLAFQHCGRANLFDLYHRRLNRLWLGVLVALAHV